MSQTFWGPLRVFHVLKKNAESYRPRMLGDAKPLVASKRRSNGLLGRRSRKRVTLPHVTIQDQPL